MSKWKVYVALLICFNAFKFKIKREKYSVVQINEKLFIVLFLYNKFVNHESIISDMWLYV